MRGSVYKRCPCGTTGTRGKPACKKAHGSWYYRADVDTGPDAASRRQPSKGGYRTAKEAQEALNAYLQDGRTDDRGQTLEQWLTTWLADQQKRVANGSMEKKTWVGYETAVRVGIVPYLGRRRLRDLRRHHIKTWIEDVQTPTTAAPPPDRDRPRARCTAGPDETKSGRACEKWASIGYDRCYRHGAGAPQPRRGRVGRVVETRKAGTLKQYRRVLRTALAAAVQRDLIPTNPALGRVESMPKDTREPTVVWEPEQVLEFLLDAELAVLQAEPGTAEHLAALREDAMYDVVAFAGPRRGELDGMRWEHTDLTSAHPGIDFGPTIVAIQGEHACYGCGKSHRGFLVKPGPKSLRSWRWVPLVAGGVLKLDALRAAQATNRERWGDAYVDHDLVFCHEDGNPLHPDWITDRFQARAQRLGLPVIKLHDMRHGAASLMLAASVPIETVAMILGHAQVSTTREVYRHLLQGPAMTGMEAAVRLVRGDPRAQIVHNLAAPSPS